MLDSSNLFCECKVSVVWAIGGMSSGASALGSNKLVSTASGIILSMGRRPSPESGPGNEILLTELIYGGNLVPLAP